MKSSRDKLSLTPAVQPHGKVPEHAVQAWLHRAEQTDHEGLRKRRGHQVDVVLREEEDLGNTLGGHGERTNVTDSKRVTMEISHDDFLGVAECDHLVSLRKA